MISIIYDGDIQHNQIIQNFIEFEHTNCQSKTSFKQQRTHRYVQKPIIYVLYEWNGMDAYERLWRNYEIPNFDRKYELHRGI